MGAQVQSKEWKGDGRRRSEDEEEEEEVKFESDSFRPVKPITVFATLITRNRVNCKLTRRPREKGETLENLKTSTRSFISPFDVPLKSDRYADSTPPGSYMALPVKNYCFSVYRFSRERRGSPRSSRISNPSTYTTPPSTSSSLPPARSPRNNNFSTATFFEDLNFPRSYFRSKSGRRHRGGASC